MMVKVKIWRLHYPCMCNITLADFKGDPGREEKGDVLGSWGVRSETYQDKKMALEV